MQSRILVMLVLLCLLATGARSASVDGYVFLDGASCHADTWAWMEGLIEHPIKFSEESGYYGLWTLVAPGYHTFEYRHAGYCPESHERYVGLFGTTTLPTVTLESCAQCNPASWQGYPFSPPGSGLSIPADEGKHMPFADYPIEWWYGNFHLTGESGKQYAAYVAFFKFPQMVLMSITDLETGETYSADKYPVIFTASEDRFDIATGLPPQDVWYNVDCADELRPFEYYLSTNWFDGGIAGLHLHMASLKPPIAIGGDGLVEIGNGWSYYYTHPRMDVFGTINIPGSLLQAEKVSGEGWIDHQWGSFMAQPVSWEWLSIQLDDQREIMAADVWVDGAQQGSFSGGLNYNDANCNLEILNDYTLTATDFWTDPISEREFAIAWRLEEPSKQIDLQIAAEHENQVTRLGIFDLLPLCFWEGPCRVAGTIGGQSVEGKAFAEVTHPQSGSVGRCILEDQTCILMTENECLDSGGDFAGLGTTCSPSHVKTEPHVIMGQISMAMPSGAQEIRCEISFQLTQTQHIDVEIFDPTGRLVRRLYAGMASSGENSLTWNYRNEQDQPVAPGTYFCRVATDRDEAIRKVLVLK